MLRTSRRSRCLYGSGLFGDSDLRVISNANEYKDQGCAMHSDGPGCIVSPLNSIIGQSHSCYLQYSNVRCSEGNHTEGHLVKGFHL